MSYVKLALTQEVAKSDSSSAPLKDREVLFIPREAFPEEMRAWVVAHGRLNLEKIKEVDKEVEVKGLRDKQSAKAIEAQLKPKEVEVKEIRAERPARAREVQLKPSYTYASQEWGDIDIVSKAKAGVNGAWFYTNNQRGSVVVKAGEDLEIQLMGTAFLRLMGISAPDLRSEKILIGMERALDRLAKLADNMEELEKLFVQFCSERGGKAKALPDHAIASLQHIKSIKSSK